MKKLITILFAVALGLNLSAQVPNYVPTEGLVAWYPFNGNAEDVGGNNFDGTPFNVSWGLNRFGEPNSAVDLTEASNDFIDLPAAVDSFFFSTITVSCWVNYPAISGQMIFRNGSTPGLYDTFHAFISNQASTGNMTLRLYTLSGEYTSYEYADDEAWKHLVMTADSEEVNIYVDGTLVHEDTIWPFDNSPGIFRIGESMYGQPYNYLGHIDDFGIWNRSLTDTEIQGLFTSVAPNFGCTDPEACNYSTLANIDDESCHYPLIPGDCDAGSVACADGTYWNSLIQQCVPTSCPTCPGDGDGDLVIGVSDLLLLLGAFGSDCPDTGCTDSQATNFNPNVVINDGSCVYPPCLDAQEPGAACEDGNPNTFNTYWDEDGCLCEGSEYVAEDGSGPCEGLGTVTYQGHDYQLVEIGEQCWFQENLRNEHYANGDAIPGELNDGEWISTTNGAQAIYANDASNLTDYGRLYNWFAVDDSRGLCPSGWHVPTDGEFMTLEMELGMSESEANGMGFRGTDQGTQMKSSASDSPAWNGSNTSGFSGLAGGFRLSSGGFDYEGYDGVFWSASALGTNAWYRKLSGGYTGVSRSNDYLRSGFSVRCVRD